MNKLRSQGRYARIIGRRLHKWRPSARFVYSQSRVAAITGFASGLIIASYAALAGRGWLALAAVVGTILLGAGSMRWRQTRRPMATGIGEQASNEDSSPVRGHNTETSLSRNPGMYQRQDSFSPPTGQLSQSVVNASSGRAGGLALADARDARRAPLLVPRTRGTLGRSRGNDIVIDDPSVSKHHAVFDETAEGSWRVSSLESRNPLLVNGIAATKNGIRVAVGDTLVLGHTVLRVVNGSAATFVQPDQADLRTADVPLGFRSLRSRSAAEAPTAALRPNRVEVPTSSQRPTAVSQLVMTAAGETSAGDRRYNNDVYVTSPRRAAIADAVGEGDAGMAVAATVRTTLKLMSADVDLRGITSAIHHQLLRLAGERSFEQAASTLDLLRFDPVKNQVIGLHVGDGQVYLASPSDAGIVVTEVTRPDRGVQHQLVNYVGHGLGMDQPSPYLWTNEAQAEQWYVMATDGFVSACGGEAAVVVGETIQRAATDRQPVRKVAERLIKSAIARHKSRAPEGTPADNLTVVVVEIAPERAEKTNQLRAPSGADRSTTSAAPYGNGIPRHLAAGTGTELPYPVADDYRGGAR